MDYGQKLHELMITAVKQNASDLHIGVGKKPTLRIDGILVPLEKEPIVTPDVAEGLVGALITDEQKARFIEHKEIDFSYALEDKARFRVNVYHQRG